MYCAERRREPIVVVLCSCVQDEKRAVVNCRRFNQNCKDGLILTSFSSSSFTNPKFFLCVPSKQERIPQQETKTNPKGKMGSLCCSEADDSSSGGYTSAVQAARRDPKKRDKFAKEKDDANDASRLAEEEEKENEQRAGKSAGDKINRGNSSSELTSKTPNSASSTPEGHDRYKKYRESADEGAHESYQSALHDTEYDSMEARRRATSDNSASSSNHHGADPSQRDSGDLANSSSCTNSQASEAMTRAMSSGVVAGFITLIDGIPHCVQSPASTPSSAAQ